METAYEARIYNFPGLVVGFWRPLRGSVDLVEEGMGTRGLGSLGSLGRCKQTDRNKQDKQTGTNKQSGRCQWQVSGLLVVTVGLLTSRVVTGYVCVGQ